ncbi:hypothetical protein T492DRAFT_932083 [Pavlovales sp. CCMP2436]|nr:hypothetical protein T492DRAFT_932083 [Pavlovales sp. CCMP2436]
MCNNSEAGLCKILVITIRIMMMMNIYIFQRTLPADGEAADLSDICLFVIGVIIMIMDTSVILGNKE